MSLRAGPRSHLTAALRILAARTIVSSSHADERTSARSRRRRRPILHPDPVLGRLHCTHEKRRPRLVRVLSSPIQAPRVLVERVPLPRPRFEHSWAPACVAVLEERAGDNVGGETPLGPPPPSGARGTAILHHDVARAGSGCTKARRGSRPRHSIPTIEEGRVVVDLPRARRRPRRRSGSRPRSSTIGSPTKRTSPSASGKIGAIISSAPLEHFSRQHRADDLRVELGDRSGPAVTPSTRAPRQHRGA